VTTPLLIRDVASLFLSRETEAKEQENSARQQTRDAENQTRVIAIFSPCPWNLILHTWFRDVKLIMWVRGDQAAKMEKGLFVG
jgi:hypothetical protein